MAPQAESGRDLLYVVLVDISNFVLEIYPNTSMVFIN